MKKKVALLALTVMIVVVSLTALVACDPDGGDGGKWMAVVDEQEFNTLLDKMLAYADNFCSVYPEAKVGVSCVIINYPDKLDESEAGTALTQLSVGHYETSGYGDYSRKDDLRVCYFASKENATKRLSELSAKNDGYIYTQKDNVIIIESETDIYKSAMEIDTISDSEFSKFYKTSLNAEARNNNTLRVESYIDLGTESRPTCAVVATWPISGNRFRTYVMDGYVNDDSDNTGIEAELREYYSEDSYFIIKNTDEIKYVQYYLEPKIGQWFSDLEDEKCSLDMIYYDGTSVTISAYHDGKLVAEIGDIFYDDTDRFLTDIYYDGTIEQWNAINKTMYNSERFFAARNIHCSDGVIEKTADAE